MKASNSVQELLSQAMELCLLTMKDFDKVQNRLDVLKKRIDNTKKDILKSEIS